MMEAVSTSETSVNFYQTTRRNIPEDSIFVLAVVKTWNLTEEWLFSETDHFWCFAASLFFFFLAWISSRIMSRFTCSGCIIYVFLLSFLKVLEETLHFLFCSISFKVREFMGVSACFWRSSSSSSSSSVALQPTSGLGLSCGFHDSYSTMWVISSTIDVVLHTLIQPSETSSSNYQSL
jgi:hypothetical protein